MALRKQPGFISRYLLINDFAILNSMLVVCLMLELLQSTYNTLYAVGCLNISWLVVVLRLQIYHTEHLVSGTSIVKKTFNAVTLFAVLTIAIFYFVKVYLYPSSLLMFMFGYFLTLVSTRGLFILYLRCLHRKGYDFQKVLVIGQSDEALRLIQFLESGQAFGTQIAGIIDDQEAKTEHPVIGSLDDLGTILNEIDIDVLYWAAPPLEDAYMHMLIEKCEMKMTRFSMVPSYMSYTFKNMQVDDYQGLAVMHYRK